MRIELNHDQVRQLCRLMGQTILATLKADMGTPEENFTPPLILPLSIYGIPRGGVTVAYMLEATFPQTFVTVAEPHQAICFVDDLIDSGATKVKWESAWPTKKLFALIDKSVAGSDFAGSWVAFPWERGDKEGYGIEDNIVRILQFIGEDPTREGLLETPKRVARAYQEWFDGYKADIPALFKTFTDGAENCDEVIIVDSIPVESFCEHHMARFNGVAHVGYIPNGKIIGLSKIPKLVKAFSHRLQVQERLTNQIASALIEHLNPKGVAVVLRCAHTCMCSRGARVHGTITTTSSMRGAFLHKPEARAEFFSLIPVR